MAVMLDIDSITNEAMMAVDKVMRKHGIVTCHRSYDADRKIMTGILAMRIAEQNDLNAAEEEKGAKETS